MSSVHRLLLRHPRGETPIFLGAGALRVAGELLADWVRDRTLFVVTTPRVLALHGGALAPCREAAACTVVLEVEEGEAAKTLERAGELWRRMLAAGGRRDSRLVAFGGGSVGDLGGFVAGCFLRGIAVAQLPTTLLAQVDASIGGKTAVDLPAAKNAVGLFHHPELVVGDTSLLATLPAEEVRSGLAEVLKMGVIADPALVGKVEATLERLLAADPQALAPVVLAAAAAKVRLVAADPEERGGDRRLLNFGHTLGHALETAAGYRGLRHGEAVAYGMLFALRLARRRGFDAALAARLAALLSRFGLPPLPPLVADEVLAAVARDKKASEAGPVWILPRALGEAGAVAEVAAAEVAELLAPFLAAPFAAG
jgi:3-dehydroquinate synthase